MTFDSHPAPHIRYHENTRGIQGDVLLSMLFVYAMAFYFYGVRTLLLALVSVSCSLFADILCVLLRGKRPNFREFSPLVTGMIIPLLLPASIPFHVAGAAALFGILVAKQPFGGAGFNIFNPAAAGVAFATVCFPTAIFSYPLPLASLPVMPGADVVLTNAPAFTLHLGGVPNYDWVEMALGNFPGPMGATHILVILACLLYLILRGTVRWQLPIFFLLTFAALCWLFPRTGMDRLQTVLFEGMSGALLFGSVFMLPDPVTSPQRNWSCIIYAVTAAVITLLFRRYGRLEEDFVFVLLLMNSSVWLIDWLGERLAGWLRRKHVELRSRKKTKKKA